jgi:hypothetical protein
MRLPVQTALWLSRTGGALVVDVGVHWSVVGSYRPPVAKDAIPLKPPHTTMVSPVQTVEWNARAEGPLVVEVSNQVSVAGS